MRSWLAASGTDAVSVRPASHRISSASASQHRCSSRRVHGLPQFASQNRATEQSQDQKGRLQKKQLPDTSSDDDGWPPHSHKPTQLSLVAKLTLDIKECTSWQQLQAVAQDAPTLNHIHVTALATRLAALMPEAGSLQRSSSGSSTSSTNGARAAAGDVESLHCLVQHVEAMVQDKAGSLDARGIANTVWALARIMRALRSIHGLPSDATVGDSLPTQGGAFSTSASSSEQTANEGGAMELQEHASSAASALLQRAGSSGWTLGFTPQHMANMLWAAAVLGIPLAPDHSALYFAATQTMLPSMNGQGLSNILWACARLGMPPPTHWLQHLYSLPPSQLQQLGPQAVASTLWALATMSNSSSSSSSSSSRKSEQLGRTQSTSSIDASHNGGDLGNKKSNKQRRGAQQQQQQQQLQGNIAPHPSSPQGPSATSPFPHQVLRAFPLPPPSWSLALLSSAHTYMLSTLHNSGRQDLAEQASRSTPRTSALPEQEQQKQQQQQQQLNGAKPSPAAKAGQSPSTSTSSSKENEQFGPQALANTVWAVHRLLGRPPSEEWMRAFYAASATQVLAMEGQQLSSTLWAVARLVLGPSQQPLPSTTLPPLLQYPSPFNGRQSYDDGVAAYGRVDTAQGTLHWTSSEASLGLDTGAAAINPPVAPSADWLCLMAEGVRARMPQLSDQALANASWSLAHLGWAPSGMHSSSSSSNSSSGSARTSSSSRSGTGGSEGQELTGSSERDDNAFKEGSAAVGDEWLQAWCATAGVHRLENMLPQAAGMCATAGVIWAAAEAEEHTHAVARAAGSGAPDAEGAPSPSLQSMSPAAAAAVGTAGAGNSALLGNGGVEKDLSALSEGQDAGAATNGRGAAAVGGLEQQLASSAPQLSAQQPSISKPQQASQEQQPNPLSPQQASLEQQQQQQQQQSQAPDVSAALPPPSPAAPPPPPARPMSSSIAAQLQRALEAEEALQDAQASLHHPSHTPGSLSARSRQPSSSPTGMPVLKRPTSHQPFMDSTNAPTDGKPVTPASKHVPLALHQIPEAPPQPSPNGVAPVSSAPTSAFTRSEAPSQVSGSLPLASLAAPAANEQQEQEQQRHPQHAHSAPMTEWLEGALTVLARHLFQCAPAGSLHMQSHEQSEGVGVDEKGLSSSSSSNSGREDGMQHQHQQQQQQQQHSGHSPRELLLAASGPLMALARLRSQEKDFLFLPTVVPQQSPHQQQQQQQKLQQQLLLRGVAGFLSAMGSFLAVHGHRVPPSEVAAALWALARLGCAFEPAWVEGVPFRLLTRCLRRQQQQQQWQQQQHKTSLPHKNEQDKGQDLLAPKELSLLMWACERWNRREKVAYACAAVSAASLGGSSQASRRLLAGHGHLRNRSGSSSSSSPAGSAIGPGASNVAVALMALARRVVERRKRRARVVATRDVIVEEVWSEGQGKDVASAGLAPGGAPGSSVVGALGGPTGGLVAGGLPPPPPPPPQQQKQHSAQPGSLFLQPAGAVLQQQQQQQQQQQEIPTHATLYPPAQSPQLQPLDTQDMALVGSNSTSTSSSSVISSSSSALDSGSGSETFFSFFQEPTAKAWKSRRPPMTKSKQRSAAAVLLQQASRDAQQLSAQDLCQVLWSAVALHARPSRDWLCAMQRRLMSLLAQSSQQSIPLVELPVCAWALARLGLDCVSRPEAAAMLQGCLRMLTPETTGGKGSEGTRLVDPNRPNRLLCMLWSLRVMRVRPSAAWWTAVLCDSAWEACLMGPMHAGMGKQPGSSSSSSTSSQLDSGSSNSSLALRSLLSGFTGRVAYGRGVGWGPQQLMQLLKLLQKEQVLPPVSWVRGLRKRAVWEVQQQQRYQQQQAQLHPLQGPHGRPNPPLRHLPQPPLPPSVVSLLAWSVRLPAVHSSTQQALLSPWPRRDCVGGLKPPAAPSSKPVKTTAAAVRARMSDPLQDGVGSTNSSDSGGSIHSAGAAPGRAAVLAAEMHWLRTVVVVVEQQLPRLSLADMGQLLSGLAARGRAVDDAQLDLLVAKLLAVSYHRMVAILARQPASPPPTTSSLQDAVAAGVLELLQGVAAVKARPDPAWAQAAADVLGLRMQLGQMSKIQAAASLPSLVAARCTPPRRWLLGYLGRVVVPLLQQQQQSSQPSAPSRTVGEAAAPGGQKRGPSAATGGQDSAVNVRGEQHSGTHSRGLTPGELSAITSALLKSDSELGQRWVQQLAVTYGG